MVLFLRSCMLYCCYLLLTYITVSYRYHRNCRLYKLWWYEVCCKSDAFFFCFFLPVSFHGKLIFITPVQSCWICGLEYCNLCYCYLRYCSLCINFFSQRNIFLNAHRLQIRKLDDTEFKNAFSRAFIRVNSDALRFTLEHWFSYF